MQQAAMEKKKNQKKGNISEFPSEMLIPYAECW